MANKKQAKRLNNDQAIKKLMRELNMLETGILRERLICIAELTKQSVEAEPEKWSNPIFHHSYYTAWADKVLSIIQFQD